MRKYTLKRQVIRGEKGGKLPANTDGTSTPTEEDAVEPPTPVGAPVGDIEKTPSQNLTSTEKTS